MNYFVINFLYLFFTISQFLLIHLIFYMIINKVIDNSCLMLEEWTCYQIDSWISWPTLWFSSWVHWDEVGPQRAIKILLKELNEWTTVISKWKLIIVPEANPFAVKENVRSANNINLNRIFADDLNTNSSPEHTRTAFLKNFIKETKPDVILDLHSMSGETSVPFLYSRLENIEMAAEFWIAYIVAGWSKLSEQAEAMWIRALWVWLSDFWNQSWIPSFTLEAGTHDSPSSEINTMKFIKNVLKNYWMIENYSFELAGWDDTVTVIEMMESHFCSSLTDPKETFIYKINPLNFVRIGKWTHVADDNGNAIYVDYDAILVQPTTPEAMVPGNEAYFLGKIIEEKKVR